MTYIPGNHWLICDITGLKIRRSRASKTYDGLMVRRGQNDGRHPQEGVRARSDRTAVKDPRPRPADVFLSPGDVTEADL